jgi:hypothetical protein
MQHAEENAECIIMYSGIKVAIYSHAVCFLWPRNTGYWNLNSFKQMTEDVSGTFWKTDPLASS